MGKSAKLKRVQDLFNVGGELVIPDGDESLVFWVQNPSSLDVQQIQDDARSAMLAAMFAFDGSKDEQEQVQAFLSVVGDEQLAQTLVLGRDQDKIRTAVFEEVMSLEKFQEEVEFFQNFDPEAASAEESAQYERVAEWVVSEGERREKQLLHEAQEEALAQGRGYLEREYRQLLRGLRGNNAYMIRRRHSEIFHALRECEALVKADGFDHSKCDHSKRFLDSLGDVQSLGDVMLELVLDVLQDLKVPERTAGK